LLEGTHNGECKHLHQKADKLSCSTLTTINHDRDKSKNQNEHMMQVNKEEHLSAVSKVTKNNLLTMHPLNAAIQTPGKKHIYLQ
jgi:hypothetical protein